MSYRDIKLSERYGRVLEACRLGVSGSEEINAEWVVKWARMYEERIRLDRERLGLGNGESGKEDKGT